jgi:hypothetical protein
LGLSDTQLHLVDLAKSSKDIWEQLSKLFGEKALNAKFSLKLQLFSLKMQDEIPLSSHINALMSLLRKLVDVGTKVEAEDSKAIMLNSLSSKYNNIVFALSQMSSQSLEEMVASLLAEEKRMNPEDTNVHHEIALFSKGFTDGSVSIGWFSIKIVLREVEKRQFYKNIKDGQKHLYFK